MPKIVDHQKRRDEIVGAARELIIEGGDSSLTVRRLAERCHVANGALRIYFASKRDVLAAVLQDAEERTRHDLAFLSYGNQRGLEALRTLYSVVLSTEQPYASNSQVVMALRESLAADPELDAMAQRWQAMLRDLTAQHLAEARADGEIAGQQSIEVATYLVVSAHYGSFMQWMHHDLPAEFSAVRSAALEALFAAA